MVGLGLVDSTAKMDVLATAVDGIENRGNVSVNVKEGETYTIPKGYHNGSGTVSGVSGGGNYTLQSKTVTPTKSQQNVTSDEGYYGLSDVTVEAIPGNYQDVSSVDATAENVLANKKIVDAEGNIVVGTMPNRGTVTTILDTTNTSQTIEKGYHSGSGEVAIVLEEKSATPSTATQEIVPTSGKVLSKVTVNPIPSKFADLSTATATADKVLEGSSIAVLIKDEYGTVTGNEIVYGTMTDNGAVSETLDTTKTSCTVPKGYHNGSGTVKITTEEKSVTPTKSAQTITPASGKVLSKVTVDAIPDNFTDSSDATAQAADILTGETAYINNVKVTGTMANNGSVTASIDGLTVLSYTIPKGYHDGTGTVSLDDSIEQALAAI